MTVVAGAIGLVVILTVLTIVWAISVRRHDASIVDICWGPAFALLAWLYCVLLNAFDLRQVATASLVTIWGVRLGIHIYSRHHGEDPRYVAMRQRRGASFWKSSLFSVFWLQAVILWLVALPLLISAANTGSPTITLSGVLGIALFTIGFGFEAIGDYQLTRFRQNPVNRNQVLDTGLWRYTRHPNYFGDAVLWWGLFLLAISGSAAYWTALSPLVMTFLLLRVSGVTLLERNLKVSKPGYEAYVRRTPAFFPWLPKRDFRVLRSREARRVSSDSSQAER